MDSKKLQLKLERIVEQLHERDGLDAQVKVSFYDIETGVGASVDGDKPGWAASIIKLPIMVAYLQAVEKGTVRLDDSFIIDHRFTLEQGDPISSLEAGTKVKSTTLLYAMIVRSDNEATNILADQIGVDVINESMGNLGMDRSMLGHLLCANVPRYTTEWNDDGSNITCPNDMTLLMRHLYDEQFSSLSPFVRSLSDSILSGTTAFVRDGASNKKRIIKSKGGAISDPKEGDDIHAIDIIDDRYIVSVMMNKIKSKKVPIISNLLASSGNTSRVVFGGALTFKPPTTVAFHKIQQVVVQYMREAEYTGKGSMRPSWFSL